MSYDETVRYLYQLEATRGWDLKLGRVRDALARLGHPERAFPSVLIAGTNGKGSTAALVHEALLTSGKRAGLYTSPHLVHFTERIRIGRQEISRESVVSGVERIRSVALPEQTGLTFFEVGTILGLLAFADCRVDAAVLEVGLGGRLDATNVVEPTCSAVVSIGLDHTDYLGTTLGEIAREKAGVMRAGRPTVLGAGLPAEARVALESHARVVGAHCIDSAELLAEAPPVALTGQHMRRNSAVALALLRALASAEPQLRVSDEEIRRAFDAVRWPGRLDVVHAGPTVICDGAHNREGMAALIEALPEVAPAPYRLLFAALHDKPWRDLVRMIEPVVSEASVVTLSQKRAVPAGALREAFARVPCRIGENPGSELERFLSEDRETPVLVAGSLFLVGAVYQWLLERRRLQSVFDLGESGSQEYSG